MRVVKGFYKALVGKIFTCSFIWIKQLSYWRSRLTRVSHCLSTRWLLQLWELWYVAEQNLFFWSTKVFLKHSPVGRYLLASVLFHHEQKPASCCVFQSLTARSTVEAALYLSPANSVPIHLGHIFYMLRVLIQWDKWKVIIVHKLELGNL